MCSQSPRRRFHLGMACALASLVVAARAMAASASADAWTGVISSPGRSITRIEAGFDGKRMSLHFGDPANCRIAANLLYRDDDTSYYRFRPSENGGGFCRKLYPGEVSVTWPSSESAVVTFHNGDARWSGTLDPAGTP